MSDIVERLRDWEEYDEGKINDARVEAADRIEQLEKQVREMALQSIADLGQATEAYKAQMNAEKRIERLEAALRQIAGIDEWDNSEHGFVDKARAALAENTND